MVDKKKSLLEAIVEVKLGKTIFEANTSLKKDDEEEDLTPEQKAKEKASKATKTLTPEPGIVLDKSKYKGIDYKNQEKIPGDLMRRAWQPRVNKAKAEAEKAETPAPSATKPETKTPEPESKSETKAAEPETKPEAKSSAPDLVINGTPENKKPETFSQAFARARKEAPATGQFQWTNPETGKTGTYQTNIKGKGTAEKPEEKYVPSSKQTETSVKSNKELAKKMEEHMNYDNPLIEAFYKFRQKKIDENLDVLKTEKALPKRSSFKTGTEIKKEMGSTTTPKRTPGVVDTFIPPKESTPKASGSPTTGDSKYTPPAKPHEDEGGLTRKINKKAEPDTSGVEDAKSQSVAASSDTKAKNLPFTRGGREQQTKLDTAKNELDMAKSVEPKTAPTPPPRPSSIPRPYVPTPPPKSAELKKEPEKSFAARSGEAAIKRSEGIETKSGGN